MLKSVVTAASAVTVAVGLCSKRMNVILSFDPVKYFLAKG